MKTEAKLESTKHRAYVHKNATPDQDYCVYSHPDHTQAVVAYDDGEHVLSPGLSKRRLAELILEGIYLDAGKEVTEKIVTPTNSKENPRVLRKISGNN